MATIIKTLSEGLTDRTSIPAPWDGKIIQNDDNLAYCVWNEATKEALIVDPVREDCDSMLEVVSALKGFRFLGVIDTHTHADHISGAAQFAEHLKVPLIQHARSACSHIHLRVARDMIFPTAAGSFQFLLTPGHTPDGLAIIWGPFLFTGDTILYGDTGRDDLPGGDPAAHWESLQKIKAHAKPETIFMPGHDGGGRLSSWKTQLEENTALKQDKPTFIADGGAYTGPAPKRLKESLYENLK